MSTDVIAPRCSSSRDHAARLLAGAGSRQRRDLVGLWGWTQN